MRINNNNNNTTFGSVCLKCKPGTPIAQAVGRLVDRYSGDAYCVEQRHGASPQVIRIFANFLENLNGAKDKTVVVMLPNALTQQAFRAELTQMRVSTRVDNYAFKTTLPRDCHEAAVGVLGTAEG